MKDKDGLAKMDEEKGFVILVCSILLLPLVGALLIYFGPDIPFPETHPNIINGEHYQVHQLAPLVTGRLIMPGTMENYPIAYYSMLPIYHNISVISGWAETYAAVGYYEKIKRANHIFLNNNTCEEIVVIMAETDTTNILTLNEECNILYECEFKLLGGTYNLCLFEID